MTMLKMSQLASIISFVLLIFLFLGAFLGATLAHSSTITTLFISFALIDFTAFLFVTIVHLSLLLSDNPADRYI